MIGATLRMAAIAAVVWAVAGGTAIAVECDVDVTEATEAPSAEAPADEIDVAGVPSPLWRFYKKYKTLPHYRALVCAGHGIRETVGCSSVCGAKHPRVAIEQALDNCWKMKERNPSLAGPCTLRFVGDTDVFGMNRSQIDQVVEQYQKEVGPVDLGPGIWPGPVAGIAGVRVRKFTFTKGVKDALPIDDVAAIRFSDGSFYIHVKWELDLAVVKQFLVRYEVFDAADRLVSNRSAIYAPESPRWNTWQQIRLYKVNQPGKWKVSIYVSTGPGEAKVGETYLTVKPEITQLPPEPIPLTINIRMDCVVSENGSRFSIYMFNSELRDRTCRASCSYTDKGQDGVLACSGTIPARARHMVFCTKYGRHSKFVFTGKKTLACD